MRTTRLLLATSVLLASFSAAAVDQDQVRDKWHTPYGLYLDPHEAHAMKTADPQGVLFIDVRSVPEVQFVGFSEMVDANIPIYAFDPASWKARGDSEYGHFRKRRNQSFVGAVDRLLQSRGLDRDAPIILMCTSGGRSPVAARTLHEAGFGRVYTQYQGFEGIKAVDGPNKGQRVVNGWRNAGLPWGYRLPADKMYFNFDPASPAAEDSPQ